MGEYRGRVAGIIVMSNGLTIVPQPIGHSTLAIHNKATGTQVVTVPHKCSPMIVQPRIHLLSRDSDVAMAVALRVRYVDGW